MKFDYSGWATKNDLVCSDGRIIRQDAFKDNDGEIVPLVWNHQHNDVSNVLGHAMLKNVKGGVRAYLSFNNTENGQIAKEAVGNGDIRSLSIFANKLKQKGSEVLHGAIKEVSLVVAGANPGAKIDAESFAHDEDGDDGWFIYTTDLPLELYHAEEKPALDEFKALSHAEDKEKEKEMADEKNVEKKEDEKTVKEVFETLNEEQKTAVYAIIGAALDDSNNESDEEEKEVKHNLFENEAPAANNTLTHADQVAIVELSKKTGSFQDALEFYLDNNELRHADGDLVPASGFVQDTSVDGNVTWLFPEYKDARPGDPELITNDQGWITSVLNKVHKLPFSRVRTRSVDIRNIQELRAKGYAKGHKKKLTGNFVLAKRQTDPTTIYVKNALHKDDIADITDFDYVSYMYNIDKMMLNEDLATAILVGDPRTEEDEDRINPENIRPIWKDDDLYTIHTDIDFAAAKRELQGTNTGAYFGDNYIHAEAMVNACLYSREHYKGSGQPDMYIHPHELNIMLMARDMNGRRIYSSKTELAAALNVNEIHTVEQFENLTRTEGEGQAAKTKKLLALIVNLADYSVGSTKGGEISHFTQFDIDYNQQKSLIETRLSGALTRLWSAIAIEEVVNP